MVLWLSSKPNPRTSGDLTMQSSGMGIPRRGKSTCKGPERGENKGKRLGVAKSFGVSWATLKSLDFIPDAKGSHPRCR